MQQNNENLTIQLETLLHKLEAAHTQNSILKYELSLDKKKITELQDTIDMQLQKQEQIEMRVLNMVILGDH